MEEIIYYISSYYNTIISLPTTFLLLGGAALSFIIMGCIQFYVWLTPEKRKEFSDYFISFQSLKNIIYNDNTVILVFNLHKQYKFYEFDDAEKAHVLNKHMSHFASNFIKIVNQHNGIIKKNSKNNIIVIWNDYNYDDIDSCIFSIIEESNRINLILKSEKIPLLKFGISLTNTISDDIVSAIEDGLKIEEYTNTYKVNVIVDENAQHLINPKYILEIDDISDSKFYTMITNKVIEPSITMSHHHKFISAYYQKRYDMAISIGTSLKTAWDSSLSDYYSAMINKCKSLKSNEK